jgi:hypothetical protein
VKAPRFDLHWPPIIGLATTLTGSRASAVTSGRVGLPGPRSATTGSRSVRQGHGQSDGVTVSPTGHGEPRLLRRLGPRLVLVEGDGTPSRRLADGKPRVTRSHTPELLAPTLRRERTDSSRCQPRVKPGRARRRGHGGQWPSASPAAAANPATCSQVTAGPSLSCHAVLTHLRHPHPLPCG